MKNNSQNYFGKRKKKSKKFYGWQPQLLKVVNYDKNSDGKDSNRK